MSTPIEIVTAFSNAFPEDGGKVAIRQYFTPKTVYVNEGVSKTTGIEEAIAFLERPNRSPSIAAVRFDMLAIAADGNRVLTERLDRFLRSDGSEIAAIKLMGIFEVDGDYIVAWRDYADINEYKQISGDQNYLCRIFAPAMRRLAANHRKVRRIRTSIWFQEPD